MKFLANFNRFVPRQDMNQHLVFVYGTLKKGEPNHHWLDIKENGFSKFVSTAKTVKKYPLVIASKYNIPFLLYSPGVGGNVVGEVYEIDNNMLSRLDELEDHPSFYIRETDQVEFIADTSHKNFNNSEKTVDCWIYFLKKFKPALLNEDFLLEYQSQGPHGKPYTPSHQRIPGYHARTDVLLS